MLTENENRFINRFLFHTRFVQNNMLLLEKQNNKYEFLKTKDFELINRSLKHDIDKINSENIDSYVMMSAYYYLRNNNLPFDHIDISKHKIIANKHYSAQRHHFYDNDLEPNIIDMCEMCCDIDAVSSELKEQNNTIYFDNVLMKNYEKIRKNEKILRKILKLLENKNLSNTPTKKDTFLDKYLNNIRKFQDYVVKIEKNMDKLPFKINKWFLTRQAINYNIDDFSDGNISKIYDKSNEELFYYNKNKIKNNYKFEGIADILLLCNALSYFNNDYMKYIDINNNNYKYIINIIK